MLYLLPAVLLEPTIPDKTPTPMREPPSFYALSLLPCPLRGIILISLLFSRQLTTSFARVISFLVHLLLPNLPFPDLDHLDLPLRLPKTGSEYTKEFARALVAAGSEESRTTQTLATVSAFSIW